MHGRLLLREKIMGDKVQGSGLAHGAYRPFIAYERGVVDSTGSEGSAGSEGAAGGAAHFVILSGEKRRMLKMAYLKI